MTLTIPKTSQYTFKQGNTGTGVWAIQRVCNKLGIPTGEDADFGPRTTASAKALQEKLGVTVDGVVGPGTQGALLKRLCDREQHDELNLPANLLRSQTTYESGGLIAAVNWGTAGGVDCGYVQRRVYSGDFNDQAVIQRAFDSVYQLDLLGKSISSLARTYRLRAGTAGSWELAVRLAVLHHNYPYAADHISQVGFGGLSSYWGRPQSWVTAVGVHFPDGHAVATPLEWCQRYALGNKQHDEPGQAVRLVSNWQ